MKQAGDPSVIEWIDRQQAETLYITTITLAELLVGVAILPPGKRRNLLARAVERAERWTFLERVLPFDQAAAHAFAELTARTRAIGRPVEGMDAQIAAIAAAHGFAVATRDTAPFRAVGIEVIDPWAA